MHLQIKTKEEDIEDFYTGEYSYHYVIIAQGDFNTRETSNNKGIERIMGNEGIANNNR